MEKVIKKTKTILLSGLLALFVCTGSYAQDDRTERRGTEEPEQYYYGDRKDATVLLNEKVSLLNEKISLMEEKLNMTTFALLCPRKLSRADRVEASHRVEEIDARIEAINTRLRTLDEHSVQVRTPE